MPIPSQKAGRNGRPYFGRAVFWSSSNHRDPAQPITRFVGKEGCRMSDTTMQETPQDYIRRILGNLKGQKPLTIQAATPKKLGRLIARASAAKLRKKPAPGKWSAAEIIAHLAD